MPARRATWWVFAAVVALGSGCHHGPASEPTEDELFHYACARCHSDQGTGGPADSLGNPGPRNFTDPAFQSSRSDAQLRRAIEEGNRGMPAFGAVLTPAQITMLIAHVRKFDPKRPTAAAAPSASSSASPPR